MTHEITDTEISVNLNDDDLFTLMIMAHERDMTLNQLVNEILDNELKRRSQGNE